MTSSLPFHRSWALLGWCWAGLLIAGSSAAITLAVLGPAPPPRMPQTALAVPPPIQAAPVPPAPAPSPELTQRLALPPHRASAPRVAAAAPATNPLVLRVASHKRPRLHASAKASATHRAHAVRVAALPPPARIIRIVAAPPALPWLRPPPPGWGRYAIMIPPPPRPMPPPGW